MTYFRKFCYLNSSCIRKSITLMFMSSSRNKFTLLYQNSVTDVFVGFRPPCWCSSRWAPAWRLHTNLYKFVSNISSDISYTEYSSDLNAIHKKTRAANCEQTKIQEQHIFVVNIINRSFIV